jgi:lactoylglutathione lyase
MATMRTLHFGLRVADIDRSVAFYTALGYQVVGTVPGTGIGDLTMLKLPGDEFVTIELVHDPTGATPISTAPISTAPISTAPTGTGLNHFVIVVDSIDLTVAELSTRGVDAAPATPAAGPDDVRTTWITDPDGNRIELVQWPEGHAAGMSEADWPG